MRFLFTPVLLFLVGVGMFVGMGCRGPQPEVKQIHLREPASANLPYQVELKIENQSRGEGQVSVEIRLKAIDSNTVYEKESLVDLKPHETVHLVVEFPVPSGNYEVGAEVVYPPGL